MGAGGPPPRLRGAPRLGSSRKAGDLKRLAGARWNGGVCGLIRQYTGHLTSRSGGPRPRWRGDGGGPPRGAAWLSSVRAVRRGLGWPNERNPRGRFPGAASPLMAGELGLAAGPRPVGAGAWRKSSQYGLHRLGHTRATRAPATGRRGEGRSDPPTRVPVRTAGCKLPARSWNR